MIGETSQLVSLRIEYALLGRFNERKLVIISYAHTIVIARKFISGVVIKEK